jgi:hypothetical protein
MLLSTAIDSGTLIPGTRCAISYCHCALGYAMRAAGKEPKAESALQSIIAEWPWLSRQSHFCGEVEYSAEQVISIMFSDVERGEGTMQSLVDWVRSVEPPDPAPVTKADPVVVKRQVGDELRQPGEPTEMWAVCRD